MNCIVAIHQPNFFPWLGYFDKIACCDAFVILDDVQFPRTGAGAYSNRVKVFISGEPRWVTAPISRNHSGVRNINEMEFSADQPWRDKILRTIEMNYKKATFFEEMFSFVEVLINNSENNIAEYNSKAVLSICEELGFRQDKLFWSSKLAHKGDSNELLVSLTKAVGGDTYMCGGGAGGYQDDAVFASAGIELKRQNFQHPEYPQHNSPPFQAGLSIIDVVANIGWAGTAELLGL